MFMSALLLQANADAIAPELWHLLFSGFDRLRCVPSLGQQRGVKVNDALAALWPGRFCSSILVSAGASKLICHPSSGMISLLWSACAALDRANASRKTKRMGVSLINL
jgi:hypothetical protein